MPEALHALGWRRDRLISLAGRMRVWASTEGSASSTDGLTKAAKMCLIAINVLAPPAPAPHAGAPRRVPSALP